MIMPSYDVTIHKLCGESSSMIVGNQVSSNCHGVIFIQPHLCCEPVSKKLLFALFSNYFFQSVSCSISPCILLLYTKPFTTCPFIHYLFPYSLLVCLFTFLNVKFISTTWEIILQRVNIFDEKKNNLY